LFLMTNTYAEQEGSHSQYPPDVSVIQPWMSRAVVLFCFVLLHVFSFWND
jgi:hypothetical protein